MAGMGGALLAIMLVVSQLAQSAAATTYIVTSPDSNGGGWTFLTSSLTYDGIFKDTELYIGDVLTFTFTSPSHDLYEVPPEDLPSCSISNFIQKYTESVEVTLQTAGQHAFLCSVPAHCSTYGMHLLVTVLEAVSAPPQAYPELGPESGASGNDASVPRSGSAAVTLGALVTACMVLTL